LSSSGIRKIVLLNSHGGNDLKPLLRELFGQVEAHLFLCNWYQSINDVYPQIFSAADDHAGEMESSLGLAYFPNLIKKNADGSLAADEGAKRLSQFDAINQGWISITRPWHLLTTNSGAGNPHQATAKKGKQLVDIVTQRLSQFLIELSQAKIDSEFPYQKKPSRP
jgi:creatinine amidohydrolase